MYKKSHTKIILTKRNIRTYILRSNLPFAVSAIREIREIREHTGSSFIFKMKAEINGSLRSIVVKQSRGFLKVDSSFKLSPKRLLWEYKAIQYVRSIIGKKFLPDVLWYDAKNYIMIMNDVQGNDGTLVREDLNKRIAHEEIMKEFARLLATVHLFSYDKNFDFSVKEEKRFSKEWKRFLLKDVVNNFYTIGARKASVASIVDGLLEESRQSKQAIIWMDPIAKNIIVDRDGLRLIDFETLVRWDIAWDPAIFISDWVVSLVSEDKKFVTELRRAVKIFLTTYLQTINSKIKGKEFYDLKRRIYRYLGVFLLHRTDGANVYQFTSKQYQRVQTEGLRLLQGLYANDFAKDLIKILDIDKSCIQEEVYFKSLGYNLKGIMQIPRKRGNKKIPVVMMLHGGTDKGMLGSPALFETSQLLLQSGIAVFRFNFVGTDSSDGLLCDKTWERLEDNFLQAVRLIKKDRRFSTLGMVGRSFSATLIAAHADQHEIQAAVLQNPIFDVWYEFINLLPEVTKKFIVNQNQPFIPLGEKGTTYIKNDKQYIKGDYKFSSKIIKEFALEQWKVMQALPRANRICIIQAALDQETNPQYAEIMYNMIKPPKSFHVIKGTVHKFPGKEREVARVTAQWLIRYLLPVNTPRSCRGYEPVYQRMSAEPTP